MSLWEQVREIGADQARASEEGVQFARQALTREIARSARPAAVKRSHRRGWMGVGIGGLVAGAAATAVVIGSIIAPVNVPSASASEVLNEAAQRTLAATVLDPAPGQWIRIQEVSVQRLGWRSDPTATDGGHLDSGRQDTEITLETARSLYVPADRSADWVEDHAESKNVLEASGPDADAAEAVALQPDRLGVQVYPAGLYSVTGVGAEGVDPQDVHHFSRNALSCYYEEMPSDPQQLVAWLDSSSYEYLSQCAPPSLGDPVGFNLAPPELRAAMFQAMALVDGARVVQVVGDVTTIAFPDRGESSWLQNIDVDTAQGLIVGRGNVEDDRWSSTVHVTLVDAIPTGAQIP